MTSTTAPKNSIDSDNAPIITIDKLNKWYGKFHVLKDIDLSVNKTEKIVVCGPSGSGKSTLIRCINRLEVHQEGSIIVDGTELTDDAQKDVIEEVIKPAIYKTISNRLGKIIAEF